MLSTGNKKSECSHNRTILVNNKKSDKSVCNVNFCEPFQSDSFANVKQPEIKVNFISDQEIGIKRLN
jgi:hypothetical protein